MHTGSANGGDGAVSGDGEFVVLGPYRYFYDVSTPVLKFSLHTSSQFVLPWIYIQGRCGRCSQCGVSWHPWHVETAM